MKELPPIERLNELFSYDSITGIVTRKCNVGTRGRKGAIVGTTDKGHLYVFIDKQRYMLHRIVWKLHTGDDPSPYEIDHINRIRDDNRIANLRLVDSRGNKMNRGVFKNNKTGYRGVIKSGNRYKAELKRNKKYYYLGRFDSALEAHNARISHEAYNS